MHRGRRGDEDHPQATAVARAASAAAAVRAAAREQWECGGGLSDYCHGARAAIRRSASCGFRAHSHGPSARCHTRQHDGYSKHTFGDDGVRRPSEQGTPGDAWRYFEQSSYDEHVKCPESILRHAHMPHSTTSLLSTAIPPPLLTKGHIPVLLYECLEVLLACGPAGTYVDCTFGRGGHSTQILRRLSPEGRLFAFDVDPTAVKAAAALEAQDSRFTIIHRPFGDIKHAIPNGVELSGVLMDIGFSSPQVDEAHRGHSFFLPGPLDLRMNQSSGIPASHWLTTVTADELSWVIREYGEDSDPYMARRIAEAVLEHQRVHGPYASTLSLADVVAAVKGIEDQTEHPAKLTFQAIRVFMNSEMPQLKAAMAGALARIRLNGRLVVISFKEKEATAIRNFIRDHEDCVDFDESATPADIEHLAELYPLLRTSSGYALRQVCNPIRPSAQEIRENSRSRSATVHVMEKVPRRGPRLGVVHAFTVDECHDARVARLLQEAKLVKPSPPCLGVLPASPEWAVLKTRRESPHQHRAVAMRFGWSRAPQHPLHISARFQRMESWRCADCEALQPPRLKRCSRCGAKPPKMEAEASHL